jgi:hypothetical protein
LHNDERVKAVLFGFAQGEELSEHTASMPAVLHLLIQANPLVMLLFLLKCGLLRRRPTNRRGRNKAEGSTCNSSRRGSRSRRRPTSFPISRERRHLKGPAARATGDALNVADQDCPALEWSFLGWLFERYQQAAEAKGRAPGSDRRRKGKPRTSRSATRGRATHSACWAIDLAWCWTFHLRGAFGPAPGCAGSVLGCAVPTPGGRRRIGRHLARITEVKPTTEVTVTPRGRTCRHPTCSRAGNRGSQCDGLRTRTVRAVAGHVLTVQGVLVMANDQVLANQEKILANQVKILANQGRIEGNQAKLDKILANQEKILANQEKILAKK